MIPHDCHDANCPHDLIDFFTLRGIVPSSNILANTLHWMAAKRHEETEEDKAMTREAKRELIEELRRRYIRAGKPATAATGAAGPDLGS